MPSSRFVHTEPVPLENDSDSDFNPGTYEPPKKSNKSKGAVPSQSTTTRPGRRKRRTETLDLIGDIPKRSKKMAHRPRVASQRANPLLDYFQDLGLQSASEDEDDAEEEEEEEEEADDEKELDENITTIDNHPSGMPKTLEVLSKPASSTQANVVSSNSRAEVDSVTESETEPETDGGERPPPKPQSQPSLLKRKSPAFQSDASSTSLKRPRIEHEDESLTESESEFDDQQPTTSKAPHAVRKQTNVEYGNCVQNQSGSETESDVDSGDLSDRYLQPLPNFPLKPGQPNLGPLVLDNQFRVPARINTFLREYQRDGIRFFWERYKNGKGGVLGDDMGLGKTIQVISFLSAIMQKTGDKRDHDRRRNHVSKLQDSKQWKQDRSLPPANETWPTCLIIAPSSVVGNWERELETWGYFEVGMYIGAPKDRVQVLNDFKMGRLDIVLTSFETARKDIALLDDLPWSCIIIDEVHRVKNPRSALAVAFNRFVCTIRYGLTGTAIQNSLSEFWTLLDWTNPESVGTKRQWDGYVARPLMVGQSRSASQEQRMKAIRVAQILKEKLLPKYFLRRTKDIIKEQLPNKNDQVVFCPLTSNQIEMYKRILAMEPVQNMVRKDEPCDCGSKEARSKCCHPFDRGDLFRYLSTLIKISNHLALILPSPSDTPEQTARNRELSRVAFGNDDIPKYGPAMLIPRFCGKWMVLESLLRDWKRDPSNKVLIFTKSVRLLEMLEFHLRSRNIGFVKLDGSTKPQDRMPMIDRFHEDPEIFVFLISTMAGGTGLNLTGANKVVIFDPNWNPAHDLQAIDRAYRFGQTRDVSVFRLLGAGSIEELIYARQVYKQQQMQVGYNASFQTRYFEGVQGDKSKQGELFGIKNIFTLHEDTLATKQAVEQAMLSDFDWALANLDAKKKTTDAKAAEPDAGYGREQNNLRGLDSLLLDDNVPKIKKKSDDIEKILSDVGVRYIHRNEDLIAESAIEGQRWQTSVELTKKSRRTKKPKQNMIEKPTETWPPLRRHHKPKMSPQERLRARQTSMIQLGHITGPEQLHAFIEQKFMKWTIEKQQHFFAELDAHHAQVTRTRQ